MKKLFSAVLAACILAGCLVLSGCGSDSTSTIGTSTNNAANTTQASSSAPQIDGLTYQSTMELKYADQFAVYYYNDGYKLISIVNGSQYLVVPEGKSAPAGLSSDIVVLQQPLNHVYLAATGAMALIDALGAIDNVTLTGTNVSGWNIQGPIDALNSGKMKYAGKYSAPDYEALVNENCSMALESTMILHTPEVQEMIEQLGIPVFIERSSYESQPMGRTEWIKVYGALFNLEDKAEAIFNEKAKVMDEMQQYSNTGKTVVFFSVNSTGSVTVRVPGDYIANSINIAGGKYAFDDMKVTGSGTTTTITMEEFYKTAVNADYLVYNGTIENPLSSLSDLLSKDETFADYKAVKSGNVWQCDKSMYQSTDKISSLITDFHLLVTDGDATQMTFLKKVS